MEPEAHDQDVLCVHTVMSSYLFVFQLNRLLGLSLKRSCEDINSMSSESGFAVYEYDCVVMQQSWRVVENHTSLIKKAETNSLFSKTELHLSLFPELDRADLLVCVNGLTESVAKKINALGRVISCYRLPKKHNNIKEQLTF